MTLSRISAPVCLALAGMVAMWSLGVQAGDAVDPHARHRHMGQATTRSTASYVTPQVQLVRDDGTTVNLADELDDGRPVVLNFIYTTCTAICPIASQVFAQFQDKLGDARNQVHMLSISIDPEQDTPARLAAYASKYHPGPQWQHYTGSAAASLAAQRAFDVYRGDKMSHSPVTLLRAAPGQPWVRLDGFATADDLLGEYRGLVAAK
jgi:protein SCO1/2